MNKQKCLQRISNSALMSLALAVTTPFFNPAYADDINPLLFSKTGERIDLILFPNGGKDFTFYVDNNFQLNQKHVVVYGETPPTFRTPKNNFAQLVVFKIYYDCRKQLYKLAEYEYYQSNTRPGSSGWELIEFSEDSGGGTFSPIIAKSFAGVVADWFCHRY